MLILVWLILLGIFMGSYIAYFSYLKIMAGKNWNLKIDPNFSPNITILVPAHNEEENIQAKLENLTKVLYPKEKMEIILIDDASTDQTLAKAQDFIKKHPELPVKILRQNPRKGKASALNKGLESSSNDIIVVTDADSTWPHDVLEKALPYMADPTVGAITGHGAVSNPNVSWITRAEKGYLSIMNLLRLGESKAHSTIRFEGCFCAFKKNAFDRFDAESGADDSGTALKVVQNKFRAIFVPDAQAFLEAPKNFSARVRMKARRAVHLTGLWLNCLNLLLRGRLNLPKRIAIPEIFIMIFNPFIFVVLVGLTSALTVLYPISLVYLGIAFAFCFFVPALK
ncbi:MAG: glycosyltransferase, partial [Candidatus Bathyarchaeia archaeon]